jgi:hypothetical protein
MLTCPRCGSDAEDLADDTDEVFSLLHCEFCGEDLDATDLVLPATLDSPQEVSTEWRRGVLVAS